MYLRAGAEAAGELGFEEGLELEAILGRGLWSGEIEKVIFDTGDDGIAVCESIWAVCVERIYE